MRRLPLQIGSHEGQQVSPRLQARTALDPQGQEGGAQAGRRGGQGEGGSQGREGCQVIEGQICSYRLEEQRQEELHHYCLRLEQLQ